MDSHMDIEKPDALGGARETPLNENIHQIEKDEQAYIPGAELPESTPANTDVNELMQEAPPLTSALEALLGGLDPTPSIIEPKSVTHAPSLETSETSTIPIHDLNVQDAPTTKQSESGIAQAEIDTDAIIEDAPVLPTITTIPGLSLAGNPALTDAESNGGVIAEAVPTASTIDVTQNIPTNEEEQEHPEWEVDSSPIESSSDDSSDDSSSDESEEGENAYKLLSPEEQARILMQDDGGSDDEGGNKAKGSGTQLRTKNEIAEVVVPKPAVTITEAMPIRELGAVEAIVENTLLVKANTSGEYKVLENSSVLCLQDRSVIGVVSETIGRVQQPYYSVLFTNAAEVKEAGLEIGTKVFYSEQHSTYVFTQALKAFKGSDASNLHDEEVGDDEMEFSDDEAEAEHKRKVKQKRMEKRGGMQQNSGSSRGGHPLQQNHTPYDSGKGLSYDDNEDGPYKPLARPAGFANNMGRGEAPQEGAYQANHDRPQSRDQFRGRGRGDRGDRGRGRGDRGRGRGRGGGYQDRPNSSNGQSLPPQNQRNFQSPQFPGNFQQPPFQPYQQPGYNAAAAPQNFFPPQPYSPHQPQMAPWQQLLQQPFQSPWPNMPLPPPVPGLPGGAYINPAFFNNQQQQHHQPQPGNQNQWSQEQNKK